jgi:molybdate transport system substrate-binding protein
VRGWARLVGALFVAVCAGCTTPAARELTVLAASSLSPTLAELATDWQNGNPDTRLVASTGATSALRIQIEQGAPADILLGADTANVQALVDEGIASGPITKYATNSLVVIVPAGNPAGIATAADLARPGLCIIAAGPDVPITRYAAQLLANLAARPEYARDFAVRYEANVCSREDNVAAVVNKVTLGEGDAAIVYDTDARAGGERLLTIDVPADSNVVATYGAVTIKSTAYVSTAASFLKWLTSDAGQSVLAAHGFGAAP